MNQAVLLLGCNIGDRVNYLSLAIDALENEVGKVSDKSSIYESEPWGFDCETSFLNQVLLVETNSSADILLKKIQSIEIKLGRVRSNKGYEARTMDIDILFYNDLILETESLKIPHPELHKRRFTLLPLSEILPFKEHPILKKTLEKLLMECEDNLWVKKFV